MTSGLAGFKVSVLVGGLCIWGPRGGGWGQEGLEKEKWKRRMWDGGTGKWSCKLISINIYCIWGIIWGAGGCTNTVLLIDRVHIINTSKN